jgi:hypothetical protein
LKEGENFWASTAPEKKREKNKKQSSKRNKNLKSTLRNPKMYFDSLART